MANKPTPQIDPLPGMGPLGIPKPQTDERVCSETETTTATLVGKIQEQQSEIERLRIKLDYIKVLADYQYAINAKESQAIRAVAIQEFKTISDIVKA